MIRQLIWQEAPRYMYGDMFCTMWSTFATESLSAQNTLGVQT